MKKLAPWLILCTLPFVLVWGSPLSKKEVGKLKQSIGKAASEGRWASIGPYLEELAQADNKSVWKFMVKVVEKSPPREELHEVLRGAAATMKSRGVQSELKKNALKSKSPRVRKALLLHLAGAEDWETLIGAITDKDEQVAAFSTWRLVDAQVEEAVLPMIAQMERLDQGQKGIWDVLRNGLGKLLGGRLQSGIEYRSKWEMIQAEGGLKTVQPEVEQEEAPPGDGEIRSSVRLFGREIDCTRVVFILDVSGSMESIDPDQADDDDEDAGSRARGGVDAGDSQGPGQGRPPGKTRLERAQRELKKLLKNLPPHFKINVVAYSTSVKLWRSFDGDNPPQLHALNAKNKAAAIEFVDQFTADGVTATDTALLRSYQIEGARCFYLLSDGAATHDGRTPVPTEELLEVLNDHKDRHITVHTLGFKGADREMMKALAKHSGGKYSDIR